MNNLRTVYSYWNQIFVIFGKHPMSYQNPYAYVWKMVFFCANLQIRRTRQVIFTPDEHSLLANIFVYFW